MKTALILFIAFMGGCASSNYFWMTGHFTLDREIKWERNNHE